MLDHYINPPKNSTGVLKKLTGYLLFGLFKLAPTRVGPRLLRLFFRPGDDGERADAFVVEAEVFGERRTDH